ncbi:hypothetical protein [Bradyrhizobium sp.]|uniref:hypothetical protein n=1 Tax=Bradyrhizobium sp. TaxID=376 RepID=UPI0025BFDED7|nr:hypothetical protein [Bradyrhizobium sp.]
MAGLEDFADKLLTQLEKDLGLTKKIGLECLIEEVEGMMNIERIAASTTRLEALIFGMGIIRPARACRSSRSDPVTAIRVTSGTTNGTG